MCICSRPKSHKKVQITNTTPRARSCRRCRLVGARRWGSRANPISNHTTAMTICECCKAINHLVNRRFRRINCRRWGSRVKPTPSDTTLKQTRPCTSTSLTYYRKRAYYHFQKKLARMWEVKRTIIINRLQAWHTAPTLITFKKWAYVTAAVKANKPNNTRSSSSTASNTARVTSSRTHWKTASSVPTSSQTKKRKRRSRITATSFQTSNLAGEFDTKSPKNS